MKIDADIFLDLVEKPAIRFVAAPIIDHHARAGLGDRPHELAQRLEVEKGRIGQRWSDARSHGQRNKQHGKSSESPLGDFSVEVVGVTGFDPATPWTQTRRSTKLSY